MNPLLIILLAPVAAVGGMLLTPGRNVRAIRFIAWLGTDKTELEATGSE